MHAIGSHTLVNATVRVVNVLQSQLAIGHTVGIGRNLDAGIVYIESRVVEGPRDDGVRPAPHVAL